MTGIAAMLAWHRTQIWRAIDSIMFRFTEPGEVYRELALSTVETCGRCVALGTALASLAIYSYRRARKVGGFPVQPGHWLLLALGLGTLAALASNRLVAMLSVWFQADGIHGYYVWALVVQRGLPAFAITVVVAFAIMASHQEHRLWMLALSAAAFESISMLLGCAAMTSLYGLNSFLGYPDPGLYVIYNRWLMAAVASLIATASVTRPARQRGDYLHWAGVISWLTIAVSQIVRAMNNKFVDFPGEWPNS